MKSDLQTQARQGPTPYSRSPAPPPHDRQPEQHHTAGRSTPGTQQPRELPRHAGAFTKSILLLLTVFTLEE